MKTNPQCKIARKENRQLGRKKNINITFKRKKKSLKGMIFECCLKTKNINFKPAQV